MMRRRNVQSARRVLEAKRHWPPVTASLMGRDDYTAAFMIIAMAVEKRPRVPSLSCQTGR